MSTDAMVPAYLGRRYSKTAPPPVLRAAQEAVRQRLLDSDAAEDWESAACLCGSHGGRILAEVERHGLTCRNVLCVRCGVIRITPRWTASRYASFYERDYRTLYSPFAGDVSESDVLKHLAEGPSARKIGQFVTAAWRRYGDPRVARPAVVEIGAGGGWNLAQLPATWKRIGYDSDERFLAAGRSAFGVDLRRGFLGDAIGELGEADCILLSHVVEHVADPSATLSAIGSAIRPDALILVEVPGIFRLHKTSLDPMRYWQNAHTYTFCARTLIDACRRAGYEPIEIDEWIRVVLKPSSRAQGAVSTDQRLADVIERYLRYCENAHLLRQSASHLPILGKTAARLVHRTADAAMRGAMGLGLVTGVVRDAVPSRP